MTQPPWPPAELPLEHCAGRALRWEAEGDSWTARCPCGFAGRLTGAELAAIHGTWVVGHSEA